MLAVQNFQRKIGMLPADGYAGVLLARCAGALIRFYGGASRNPKKLSRIIQ